MVLFEPRPIFSVHCLCGLFLCAPVSPCPAPANDDVFNDVTAGLDDVCDPYPPSVAGAGPY